MYNEALECGMDRLQRPFDYSQGFRFGGGYPPFGDTLIVISVPEYRINPYEVTLDGRIGGLFESLLRQFIAPASVLNECDGSLIRIITNESDLKGDS